MNVFERELNTLKPHDPAQCTEPAENSGYNFIVTTGHGYLVIPKKDKHANIAKICCTSYSYDGDLAYYLEEDCDAPEFLSQINK